MRKKSVESYKKQVRGYKSGIKGLQLEQKVASHFSQKGWKIEMRKHIHGGEIDIYGEQEPFFEGKKYLLVECKDKELVTKSDVTRFMKKALDFYKGLPEDILGDKPPITAVIAHTGKVDIDAKDVAKNFTPKIDFQQF